MGSLGAAENLCEVESSRKLVGVIVEDIFLSSFECLPSPGLQRHFPLTFHVSEAIESLSVGEGRV